MLSLLNRLFRAGDEEKKTSPGVPSWLALAGEPVREHGPMPAVPSTEIFELHADKLMRIRRALALYRDEFDSLIYPVFERFAAFVHLLPASQSHHHCHAGGLVEHSFEVAMNAARMADGMVFETHRPPIERRELEFRWRTGAALAGLFHDLGKVVCDVGAIGGPDSQAWNPALSGLSEWIDENSLDGYAITWSKLRHQGQHTAFSSALTDRIIGREVIEWLCAAEGGYDIYQAIHSTIAEFSDDNPIFQPVKDADHASTAQNLLSQQERDFQRSDGIKHSVWKRLATGLEAGLKSERWGINRDGGAGAVWWTTEGLFVTNPKGLAAIRDQAEKINDVGLPTSLSRIQEVLCQSGFFEPNAEQRGKIEWNVELTVRGDEGREVVFSTKMLKVANADEYAHILKTTKPVSARLLLEDQKSSRKVVPAVKKTPDGAQLDIFATTKPPSPKPAPAPGAATENQENSDVMQVQGADPTHVAAIAAAEQADEPKEDIADKKARERTQLTAEGVAVQSGPQTVAEAVAYFDDVGRAGSVIIGIFQRLAKGKLVWGEDLDSIDGRLHIRFPGGLDGLGQKPLQVATMLKEAGWAEPDPASPGRLPITIMLGGKSQLALRLSHAISGHACLMRDANGLKIATANSAETPAKSSEGPVLGVPVVGDEDPETNQSDGAGVADQKAKKKPTKKQTKKKTQKKTRPTATKTDKKSGRKKARKPKESALKPAPSKPPNVKDDQTDMFTDGPNEKSGVA